MAYTRTWDSSYEALPADVDNVSDGATKIRNLKVDIRERLAKDHYFDTAGTDADHGEHNKCTLREQAADPSNVANKGFIYTKDDGAGRTELYYIDSAGTVTKLTSAGTTGGTPTAIALGDDNVTAADGVITATIDGTEQVRLTDGVLRPTTNNDVDLGTSSYQFKNVYISGSPYVDKIRQGVDLTAALNRTILEIGAWNMDETPSVSVAHGLTLNKIRSASVMVTNDAGTFYYPISTYSGITDPAPDGEFYIRSDYVIIRRRSSGQFDSTNFDYPSGNRGWIVIYHVN